MYIFEINSLSVVSFAIIFSHSEGGLFALLIVSFVVQKLLIWYREGGRRGLQMGNTCILMVDSC